MAKSYRWDDVNGRIIASGGAESDPMTFKDITDYYEANPLPLNYNLPRRYGGKAVITGDTTTFSPTAGDKIAVTINGVLYDNIDISGCTSITNVVTAINNATTAYYNVSGYNVASKDGSGYLVLTVRCEDEDGDITIADGSGTSSTCVAKLFNTAPRTLTLTNSPYELCENNASEWFGLNGMGTPADDSSAGDFTKGAYSITSQVSSVPTGVNISSVDSMSTSYRIIVYISDTSSFAVGDEVRIVGTSNFNNVIFKITYITKNTYVYGYCPRYAPLVKETGITGATLIKDLTLCWNYDFAIRVNVSPYTGIALCNKVKVSAKSDGVGSPKIIGAIIRSSSSAPGTAATSFYGAYINLDWDLTSAWQDFEFNIRDMVNYAWFANNSFRGYWNQVNMIYLVFDGLSATENVWIDGLRCTNSDRNPKKECENSYIFTTGLYISNWFKDYGFNVRFDVLESYLQYNGYVLTILSSNVGEVQLGDYSGNEKEGGVFVFNTFCIEDTGPIRFEKVQCQGITFMSFKDAYGGFNFATLNTNNAYRNCNWINMMNFFDCEDGSTFENCAMMGYRYAFAFPDPSTVIDGMTLYKASSYPFYVRTTTSISSIKNIKYIDALTTNRNLLNSDTYGTAETRNGLRLINMDISECGTGLRFAINNNAIHPIEKSPIHYLAFSFNLNLADTEGTAIEGATVTIKDKDGNVAFTTTTDSNGDITEQFVDILKCQHDYIPPSSSNVKYFYLDTPTVDWTYYYPFTLTVSKTGYETYTDILLKDGYSRTNEICKKGYSGKISLKPARIQIDQETLL